MPKLLTKTKVLGGKAAVISYERDPKSFYYRELIPGTKKYRTARIDTATTEQEAILCAIDIYAELRTENRRADSKRPTGPASPKTKKTNKTSIQHHTKEYLIEQEKRARAGLISNATVTQLEINIRLHLVPYLHYKSIDDITELNHGCFDEYPSWRQATVKGRWNEKTSVTKQTLTKELRTIKSWINSLHRKGLAPNIEVPKIKIRGEDRMSNPAIHPDDWETILKYIRSEWIPEANTQEREWAKWARYMFWNWILIAKNSGSRPEELMKLRWKDIEFEDVGRFSRSKQAENIQLYQQHNIPIDEDNLEDLGIVRKEIAHIVYYSSKTGEMRISSCNCVNVFERWRKFQQDWLRERNMASGLKPSDMIWACPYRDMESTLSYSRYKEMWSDITKRLQGRLRGHIFSNKPYTLYSLRATFVEESLLAGKDVFLVAKAAGHSVDMLMKHYERIDPRRRAKELTDFEYGKKKTTSKRSPLQ